MRVGVVGCRFNTMRFLQGLLRDNIPVHFLLTLDQTQADSVSGFEDFGSFAEKNEIEVYRAANYNLNKKDQCNLAEKKFDIVFCVGWQRLLPMWFLELSRLGVFGMHGSCKLLPAGRGRSPQVWSIILGSKKYYAHIFRYAKGADEGMLWHVESFDINPFDTTSSLQLKSQIVFNRIVKKRWQEIKDGTMQLRPQPYGKSSWFEKRSPEDGLIDWAQPAQILFDFIRAQTKPYPGAFTFTGNEKLTIWKAHIFDTQLVFNESPGLVLDVFSEDDFLVQTGDYSLRVIDFNGQLPDLGTILGCSHTKV